jgi:ribonuclease HI
MALELAQRRYESLSGYPKLKLRIFSDSKYAVNCMTEWQLKWRDNGWINAAGLEVVNRDLIEQACDLEDDLVQGCNASIKYRWIPREDNAAADQLCNQALDDSE